MLIGWLSLVFLNELRHVFFILRCLWVRVDTLHTIWVYLEGPPGPLIPHWVIGAVSLSVYVAVLIRHYPFLAVPQLLLLCWAGLGIWLPQALYHQRVLWLTRHQFEQSKWLFFAVVSNMSSGGMFSSFVTFKADESVPFNLYTKC